MTISALPIPFAVFISQQNECFSDQSISRTLYSPVCAMETYTQQNNKHMANVNLQCSLFRWTLALNHIQFCQ